MKKIVLIIALFACQFVANAQQAGNLKLMPAPRQLVVNSGKFRISNQFKIFMDGAADDTVLHTSVVRIIQRLKRKTGLVFGSKIIAGDTVGALQVVVHKRVKAAIGLDESYKLQVNQNTILLTAPTTAGALHGLRTLLQLCEIDENGYYFPCVDISDSPRFKWRGLMIDVARHFVSFEEMKNNIDAMAAVKMNVLHWHLTDDEGFRVESKLFPRLQQFGSNGDYYTQAQLKELVAYAADRGIIIVPEFDMPGHAQTWFAGYPELASQPGPYRPGPRMQWQTEHPDPNAPKSTSIMDIIANMNAPTFDATSEKVYAFLDKFIGEMAGIFPAAYMHVGADENNGLAWKKNPAIAEWMKQHNMQGTDDLQRYFVQRMYGIMKKHHRQMIGWEEIYNDKLPADAIVHKWIPSDNSMIKSSGRANDIAVHNPVLISEGFYLDLFLPAYIHYNNAGIADANSANILGGEAAQWTELADNDNIDGRIWPRAGVVAERLWSQASVTDVDDMYRRMFALSAQLDEQGLPHISNYERALRRLTNGEATTHLKTLTDVLEQVRGYRKLMAAMFKPAQASTQSTPLTSVSDIVFPDSETKRKFRALVKLYLEKHDKAVGNSIRAYLLTWKQNDEQLKSLFAGNKRLLEVQDHSKNLSAAAAIGLDALDRIEKGTANDGGWVKQQSDALGVFEKAHGETTIAVIPEIEALVLGHLVAEPVAYPAF
ncbi:MAG: beta-N-acetylhexosaminidase [Mucilaginibacter sp.]